MNQECKDEGMFSRILGARLNHMRKNGAQFCDLFIVGADETDADSMPTLEADGDCPPSSSRHVPSSSPQRIPCHRLVVLSSCDYFHSMLTGGMMEATQDTIYLHDCRTTVVEILLDYMYVGFPSGKYVNVDNILELFSWAIRCSFRGLIEFCTNFIQNSLGCDNVFNVHVFADAHNIKDVRELTLSFIQNNFEEVTEQNELEWVELDRDIVTEIISSDYLRVRNEDKIFQALVVWSNHNTENRDILGLIRSDYLSKDALEKYHAILTSFNMVVPSLQTPRRYTTRHFHLFFQSQEDTTKCAVLCFNFLKNEEMREPFLFRQPELPLEVATEEGDNSRGISCCASLTDGMLWCISDNSHLYKYNHTTRFLQAHTTMRRYVKILHMAAFDDILYAIVSSEYVTKLEMFLPSLARWRPFMSLDPQVHRIIPLADRIVLLSRDGSMLQVNPAKSASLPTKLSIMQQTLLDDCEAVSLCNGNILLHGRDMIEFTTFEFDVRSTTYNKLCIHRSNNVQNYQLFLCELDVYLIEEYGPGDIKIFLWSSFKSKWIPLTALNHKYGKVVGYIDRNNCRSEHF